MYHCIYSTAKEVATKRLKLCLAQTIDERKVKEMMYGCNPLYDFEKKVNFENRTNEERRTEKSKRTIEIKALSCRWQKWWKAQQASVQKGSDRN